jgi:hypothetical protein
MQLAEVGKNQVFDVEDPDLLRVRWVAVNSQDKFA